jgi:thiamine-phosphate pyrophosphorylase
MDPRLVAWARAVKARNRWRGDSLPVLWLFTDGRRLPDPRPSVAALPRGLCGVVLRHDGEPDREALGRDLARLCRARRLTLVVAGEPRLAAKLHAGVHLRGGRWPGSVRAGRGLRTSSAHSIPELRRASRAGARLAFLSPAFATASHRGVAGLGTLRWSRLADGAAIAVGALGGIDGPRARRLPRRRCRAVGAIGALATRGPRQACDRNGSTH